MVEVGYRGALPQPKSTKGEIKSESRPLSIKVCDTDAKQYADYVKSVQDNGFTVDYNKSAGHLQCQERRWVQCERFS